MTYKLERIPAPLREGPYQFAHAEMFSPYAGAFYEREYGDTADFTQREGEDIDIWVASIGTRLGFWKYKLNRNFFAAHLFFPDTSHIRFHSFLHLLYKHRLIDL